MLGRRNAQSLRLDDPGATGSGCWPGLRHGPDQHLRLKVWRSDQEFHVAAQGDAEADFMLEDLHAALTRDQGCAWLHLDLAGLSGVDDLAVSALVVLLRRSGQTFQAIRLTGINPQTGWRLRHMGARELLGQGWDASFQGDQVAFRRC